MPSAILAPIHTRLLQTWTVIDHGAVANTLTGPVGATSLVIKSIPGGTMGANGILRITTMYSASGTGNKWQRVRYGSGLYLNNQITTIIFSRVETIIENRNSQSSQVAANAANVTTFNNSALAVLTTAIDSSIAQDVVISGEVAVAAETLTLHSWTIEAYYKA